MFQVSDTSLFLRNRIGTITISLNDGLMLFRPECDSGHLGIPPWRVGVITRDQQYYSDERRPIAWMVETSTPSFQGAVTIHCLQSLPHGAAQLHWRIRATESDFVLQVGVSRLDDHINRFVCLECQDIIRNDSLRNSNMLCLAYCGAHSTSTLSQSRICPLSTQGTLTSWWATALFLPSGSGLVMGFLSALRFVGKFELMQGDLRSVNFGEGITGNSADVVWSEPLFIAFGSSPLILLERYAEQVAVHTGVRNSHAAVFGWGSWLHYGDSITDKIVLSNADRLVMDWPELAAHAVIQIDHGWEERLMVHRPESSWVPREQFTRDFSGMAADLRRKGLRMGLWVVPFAVNAGSQYWDQHAEYLVRDETGQLKHIGGGGNGYCVDPTHPEGEQWLRGLFAKFKNWGVSYYKLDFLRALLAPEPDDPYDGLDQPRVYWSGGTRVEAYRYGLEVIRDVVGEEAYLLACGAPILPSVGLVDGCRIGQDMANDWHDGRTGIKDCTRNVACNFFWHKHVWRNDPDFLIASEEDNLQRFWCTTVALSGGSSLISADLSKLTAQQVYALQAVIPPWGEVAQPVDLGQREFPARWHLPVSIHGENYFLVGLFNWGTEPQTFVVDTRDLNWPIKPSPCIAWEFWRQHVLGDIGQRWTVVVPGRDVALVCVRPVLPRPQLIATSLHYTMGAVDVSQMAWSSQDLSLTLALSRQGRKSGHVIFRLPTSYELEASSVACENRLGQLIVCPTNDESSQLIQLKFTTRPGKGE